MKKVSISGFIDTLAIFIKQKQTKIRKVENGWDKQHNEANSNWPNKYPIHVYDSITM